MSYLQPKRICHFNKPLIKCNGRGTRWCLGSMYASHGDYPGSMPGTAHLWCVPSEASSSNWWNYWSLSFQVKVCTRWRGRVASFLLISKPKITFYIYGRIRELHFKWFLPFKSTGLFCSFSIYVNFTLALSLSYSTKLKRRCKGAFRCLLYISMQNYLLTSAKMAK